MTDYTAQRDSDSDPTAYRAYGIHNFREIPQIARLTEQQCFDIPGFNVLQPVQ